jgi:hypothetical protein
MISFNHVFHLILLFFLNFLTLDDLLFELFEQLFHRIFELNWSKICINFLYSELSLKIGIYLEKLKVHFTELNRFVLISFYYCHLLSKVRTSSMSIIFNKRFLSFLEFLVPSKMLAEILKCLFEDRVYLWGLWDHYLRGPRHHRL